ncbi:MAG TPA: LON peptidase substrate-binding domain-containing protein [Candidatus Sulfotelmatobacter sp.]|nr:LON peptidase substrate-binding domain-containing protein [Candidatus Sulfotelmatobacter sp.]
MGSTRPERIPLFPLNVVLLPGGDLPLHIFEPRYRRMVQDCIEAKSEFGMLLVSPKGLVRVGCTAEVLDVAKRYPDGRMDIVAVGRAPFRIVELINSEQYDDGLLLEGAVDYLDDHDRPVDTRKQRELVQLYEACHTIVYGDYPRNVQALESEELSYAIAGTLPIDLMWKQQVLELRSEADRQERLVTYLREWAPHLQKIESQRRNAEGNGNTVN